MEDVRRKICAMANDRLTVSTNWYIFESQRNASFPGGRKQKIRFDRERFTDYYESQSLQLRTLSGATAALCVRARTHRKKIYVCASDVCVSVLREHTHDYTYKYNIHIIIMIY